MKNNSTNNTIVDKLPANCEFVETPFYKIYRYYSTDIVRLESENKGLMITLFTGGHYSKSMKNHMIKFLAREGINVKIQFLRCIVKNFMSSILCCKKYSKGRIGFYIN